jgi:hypothetical protein
MAEKIVNGNFATNLNGWGNIGSRQFVASGGRARGTSLGTVENYFCLRQSFTKYGATISAMISADIYFSSIAGDTPGYNRFRVELDIPGTGPVILYEAEFDAEDGYQDALSNFDITSYLVNNGTYYLRLSLYNMASVTEGVITASYGEYDNISLLVVEKFSKTVVESLGSGESFGKKSAKSILNALGLSEALGHVGGDTGGNKTMLIVEKPGLIEVIGKKVLVTVTEILGAIGALARTYGYCHHDIPSDTVGLGESMSAKVTAGNITKIVTQFDTGTRWTNRAPVDTDWEQQR